MSTSPLYGARVVATSVLLLGLGAVLAIEMFRATLGPFSFGGDLETAPGWRVAVWSAGGKDARVRSAERWDERLEGRFEFARWGELDSTRLQQGTVDLLIVDGVEIGEDDALALRSFLAAGGRLALFGPRDREDTPEAEALSALLGQTLRGARDYRWTLLPARTGPLAAGFSAADRLPLRRAQGAYAMIHAEPEVAWASASPGDPNQGAAWRGHVGSGRVVWWSVRPDFALDRVTAQATMTRVVRASVAWLLEEPFAEPIAEGAAGRAKIEPVEVRIVRRSSGRFLLAVTNRGGAECPTLRLRVFLNRVVADVSVERTSVSLGRGGLEVPDFALDPAGSELAMRIPALGPGASRSYYLDLNERIGVWP